MHMYLKETECEGVNVIGFNIIQRMERIKAIMTELRPLGRPAEGSEFESQ
jgi:hypothetical protein